jgi:uncharacterized membrane protein YeaQ/YmgE (transglycosylase-associated protein family)
MGVTVMFNFWTVLYLLVVGTIMGYLARLVVPGRDPMTWWQTVLVGVVGSFVGGFGGYLLFGFDDDEGAIQPGGIIGSFIGAVVVLLVWRWWRGRQSTSTA